MMRRAVNGCVAIGALLALLAMPAAAGAAKKYTKEFMFDRCDGLSSSGENPFFSLDPGNELKLAGKEDGEQLEVTIEVLNETEDVDGTQTRVVRETEKADGELPHQNAPNSFRRRDGGSPIPRLDAAAQPRPPPMGRPRRSGAFR